jgi:collagenase-like PrtC family protease
MSSYALADKEAKVEFSVATVWDNGQIKKWSELNTSKSGVTEIFGCRQTTLIGHGRAPIDVPYVDDETIVSHVRQAQRDGIRFMYLLNGRCDHINFSEKNMRELLRRDLEWIIEQLCADAVVISDIRLAKFVRQHYPAERIAIRVSTIAGITEPAQLLPWIPLEINGAVLHHDVGRNFDLLYRFKTFLDRYAPGMLIELLVNETCLPNCQLRNTHYSRLARESLSCYVESFQQSCNAQKFFNPWYILAAGWIRPEDIRIYNDFGINKFKIAGREMNGEWLDRAVNAYIGGKHDGNLIELFTMTPPGLSKSASEIVHIDNSALNGFLEELRRDQGREREIYGEWARKLWECGAFRIFDPESIYQIIGDQLKCVKPGRHLTDFVRLNKPPVRFDHNGLQQYCRMTA